MTNKKLKTIDRFNPIIRKFSPEYEFLTDNFNSGEFAFDNFIKSFATTDCKNGDGVTYIVIDEISDNESTLVAYYTLSSCNVHFKDDSDFEDDDIPQNKKQVYYSPISSFMINMFAVNDSYQDLFYNNELISNLILQHIIKELYEMSISILGAKMILLCSVKSAISFYERNEFCKFKSNLTLLDKYVDDTIPMYLRLHETCVDNY